MLLYAVIFITLSYFIRNEVFTKDLYLVLCSIVIGIPYNFLIFNYKMNDAYTKNLYLAEANMDSLSGLPNRRSFNSYFEKISRDYQLYISRVGGDEFVLIALDLHKNKVNKVFEDIVNEINNISIDGNIKIKSSIGAFYTEKPFTYNKEDIFIKADESLYNVKNNNKGSVEIIFDKD